MLKNFSSLRNLKNRRYPFWRIDTLFSDIKQYDVKIIENGGWHFSFLKSPKDIKKKIGSYSHQEFNKSKFTDEISIAKKIDKGEDLFERNIKYKKIKVDKSFPEYIFNNKEKLKEWIV